MKPPSKPKKILAISSGGGHWTQLNRIQGAFEGHDVSWATVVIPDQNPSSIDVERRIPIPDATRWNKVGLIRLFFRVLYVILKIRPNVIISTGAAPGYFAMVIGRILRIRTCWVDSIANVEELSLSGKKARKWADLCLTQWPHLHEEGGPEYHGSVVPELFPSEGKRQEESDPTRLDDEKVASKSGKKKRIKVMAISSGGGHWVELLRLSSALESFEVHWVTVRKEYESDIRSPEYCFHTIHDATRWNKLALIMLAMRISWILIRVRPKVVVTTGAAPGYLAVMIGSMLRIKTCWIDSLANVEELSLSGKKAGRWANLWLTQWEHLAVDQGPRYAGMLFPDLDSKQVQTDEKSDSIDRRPA